MLVTKVAHLFLDTLTHVPRPEDAAPDSAAEAHTVVAQQDVEHTATSAGIANAG